MTISRVIDQTISLPLYSVDYKHGLRGQMHYLCYVSVMLMSGEASTKRQGRRK